MRTTIIEQPGKPIHQFSGWTIIHHQLTVCGLWLPKNSTDFEDIVTCGNCKRIMAARKRKAGAKA